MLAVAAPWPALADYAERLADSAHPGAVAIGRIDGWQTADPFSHFTPHYQNARSTEKTTWSWSLCLMIM